MAAVAEDGIGGGSGDQVAAGRDQRDVTELSEMLSKLNPSAEEFVPSSYAAARKPNAGLSADAPIFDYQPSEKKIANGGGKDSSSDGSSSKSTRQRRNGFSQFRRRWNERLTKAQKEECIRRTIYVSVIDQKVTEDFLAGLFDSSCGTVIDCRVCGDPNSALRFAFVEFEDEYSARAALNLNGTLCGYHPLKVLPSKTAIMPVNESFLPKSVAEKEMCSRTIYCTNIDKKVTQKQVKDFFESLCGKVRRLRLLGDNVHTTRIAFIEFNETEDANAALSCSGRLLGFLPIRVSPSKTPVRPRTPGAMSP